MSQIENQSIHYTRIFIHLLKLEELIEDPI